MACHRWNRILPKHQLRTCVPGKCPYRQKGHQIEAWDARTQHDPWRERAQGPAESGQGITDPSFTDRDDANSGIDKRPQRPFPAQHRDRYAHAPRGECIAKKYCIAFGSAAFKSQRDHHKMRRMELLLQRDMTEKCQLSNINGLVAENKCRSIVRKDYLKRANCLSTDGLCEQRLAEIVSNGCG